MECYRITQSYLEHHLGTCSVFHNHIYLQFLFYKMDVLDLNEVTVDESSLNSDLDWLVKLVKQDWKSYAINIKVVHLMINT